MKDDYSEIIVNRILLYFRSQIRNIPFFCSYIVDTIDILF